MYATLDISKNKIGLAFSNIEGNSILYSKTIRNKSKDLQDLYGLYKPQLSIIGLATHPDGNLTKNGEFVQNFVQENKFLHPYEFMEEYFSTKEAKLIIEKMKLREEVDTMVAKIMMYKYLKMENALLHYGLYY